MIKTRFAPSPTGFLHVGALRAALFEYLFAKSSGGTFVLRIEDTDQERCTEGATENFLRSLMWAGIIPDEGVVSKNDHGLTQKGEYGPYVQSERLDIYKEHALKLIEQGDAYYAFDSKEELDAMRERQQASKLPTIYERDLMKNSLTLDEKTVQERLKGEHVIRLKMPREGKTEFDDIIRGKVEFENKLIDDQVLLKSDGFPTYHLACVVDDHLMKITHVIRGEEWISSTPKHIVLYKAFGWEPTTYAHIPLLVNEKKQKLSKRHGDVTVEDYKEKGYLPEALVNFSAFLGWNPGDERELFTMQELEEEFSLEKVGKSAAVFNLEKLDWYNKQYLMNFPLEEITKRALPFFQNAGHEVTDEKWLSKVVDLERSRAATLRELVDNVGFLFADTLEYDGNLLVWKKADAADAKEKLTELSATLQELDLFSLESLESKVGKWIEKKEYGVGNVLWPMRVALSGQKNSPGPYELANVLGKEKTLQRIQDAIGKI